MIVAVGFSGWLASFSLMDQIEYETVDEAYLEIVRLRFELIRDRTRIDWLADHPESGPYLEDGLWRIPYLVSGDGGFGGGVGTMTHRTLRGVIDLALANIKLTGAGANKTS